MSRKSKQIVIKRKGVDVFIGSPEDADYVSIGPNGTDIMIRGNGRVLAFNSWKDLVAAISPENAVYYSEENDRKMIGGV